MRPIPRLPLLALGLMALLLGLGAGLVRLGAELPAAFAAQAGAHGVLMVGGLFGVVIALERAVAVGQAWAYAAPLASGLGTVCLLLGQPQFSGGFYLLGSVGLLASTALAATRQPEPFMGVLLGGALCGVLAHLIWLCGAPLVQGLPLAIAFLVLTIAGERMELSRFVPRSRAVEQQLGAILLGIPLAVGLGPDLAPRALGLALMLLAQWLLQHDLARRTVRRQGLTRFIAVALITGYVQLLLGGFLLLIFGLQPGSLAYDAAVHALLLGFVFSMVFGHAPLIGPALLKIQLPFHALFYAPLALLHGGLLLRLGGDALDWLALRRAGAWLSTLAIALFVFTLIWRARARRPRHVLAH